MKYLTLAIFFIISLKVEAQSSAFGVADSLYAVGNYGGAIKAYVTVQNPSARVSLQLARSYKGLGVKSRALALYKESLLANEAQPIAATEYGKLLITTSRFREADSLFKRLSSDYPDNAGYYYQWGRALKGLAKKRDTLSRLRLAKRQGEMDGAVGAFAKAVQLDSTHQRALYALALHHVKERDYPEVEQLTHRALKNDSLDIEIINLRAQNVFNRGDYSTAIDRFEKLISLGVENEFIHRKLGKSYYEQRYYELSIDHYEKVLGYDKGDATVHLTLARLNNYRKNFEKANAHAKSALYLQDQPLDEIYFTMGRTYELHKKYPEAIEVLQKAIKENPDNLRAYRAIAVCADNYYKDKQAVVRLYERALEKCGNGAKNKYMRAILTDRIKILKQEIFMQGDKGK